MIKLENDLFHDGELQPDAVDTLLDPSFQRPCRVQKHVIQYSASVGTLEHVPPFLSHCIHVPEK
jgi:hypothetical protein